MAKWVLVQHGWSVKINYTPSLHSGGCRQTLMQPRSSSFFPGLLAILVTRITLLVFLAQHIDIHTYSLYIELVLAFITWRTLLKVDVSTQFRTEIRVDCIEKEMPVVLKGLCDSVVNLLASNQHNLKYCLCMWPLTKDIYLISWTLLINNESGGELNKYLPTAALRYIRVLIYTLSSIFLKIGEGISD